MAVIALCVALVAVGVVMVVRRGGQAHDAPRGVLHQVGVALAAGLAAGVLAAGAGGRLVMRLLAATSPEAKGSLTEANETVGKISLDGTLGLFVFGGLPAGLLSGALYALVRPALPPGRAGGVALGSMLLVLAGTRVEPLRSDNFDFGLVGPPWLAVVAFSALALFHGMVVVALAERWSPRGPTTQGPRVTVSRIAIAVVLLVALPGFVGALSEILDRGY